MPQPPTSTAPAAPREIAQFEIVRKLGAGGMAEVFLAKKQGAEGTYKVLVLKRILPMHGGSRRFRAMFIEEARLATRLNHPNVVQVYELQDFGDEGLLLAMEYVEGFDLGRLIGASRSRGTRVPPWVGAWIVAEAAKGLHYAHEKRDEAGQPLEIVHRDVSPQNILLSFDGGVKIADFGIASARVLAEDQGVLKGKFGYMSPEQARGENVDRRSDLYALGVILWEILVGRPIHGGLGGEALLDIVRSGIVEPPSAHADGIPPELETIAMKALSPAREDRYETGRELAATLGRAIVKQGELIDAAALEAAIAPFAVRGAESDPPSSERNESRAARSEDARTNAAVPLARSVLDSRGVVGTRAPRSDSLAPEQPSEPEGPREVRHVAVLSMRLSGLEALADSKRLLDQVKTMLDELAFKRSTRWAWSSPDGARAIVGLAENPSRATTDAAHLALDVHETLAGFQEDLPVPVLASIGLVRGIASGTRDPQGHLVRYTLHDPATLLARVVGRATPAGKTWVAGGVYRLVRKGFRWCDVPSLHLDPSEAVDVPATMRIYALERSLSREERASEAQGGSSDLVGRDAEKADLQAAFHAAVNGRGAGGQLVCRAVVGEMGIGKTALVDAFVDELPPNVRVIRVECTPVRMEVPYATVSALVRETIGATGEEAFDEVVALIARAGGGTTEDTTSPIIARLAELATNRRVSGDEDAHTRKKGIVSAVRNLVAAIALQQPLVVLVDGLHWTDKASLDTLSELVQAGDPVPVLALFVLRPDDRALPGLAGAVRIELRGLTPDEQVRLVQSRLGVGDGAAQVCADLLPRVGDNPFFLLEMIDALLERGALEIREAEDGGGEKLASLVRTEKADAGFDTLPSTLEQLLGDRIAELPASEHAVVDWLAIAGGALPVADVLKLSRAPDEDAVAAVCARGLCDRRADALDFRHPLSRDVAYAAIDPIERVKMHRILGEHLAETSIARGLSAAIVARHLARGELYDRASHFYLVAAAAARDAHQTQLVIRYNKRALAYLGADDRRVVDVHDALEGAFRMLGRRRERLFHLRELRRAVRTVGTARAVCLGLLRSARYDFDEGRLAHGVKVARQATEVAHASRNSALEVEAETMTGNFLRELGDVQGALAACDRALAAFGHAGSSLPALLHAEVLRSRGVLLRRVGRVREAVDAYVDAIAISRRSGARRMEARVKNALAYAMFVQGRYEDAVALALESIQIDLSIGGRFQIAKTLTNIGQAYFRLGDVPRSLAYLERARLAHERYGDQDSWAETLLVSAQVKIELGDCATAEAFVRDASALIAATGNAYEKAFEDLLRALLARAERRPDEAVRHAALARRHAESTALVAFHFFAMAIEASARVDLGEMHTATLLATTALGAVEHLQGCEYGLEIRSLCADALKRAGSPQAPNARQRAVDYANALMLTIRDARLRKLFPQRPMNAALFETTPVPAALAGQTS
jgi:eukaryotic-like serine/threonine-protein kinase